MATKEPEKKTDSAWATAFQNILKLEESHGFDNKAVMGGLDKFLAHWSDEMAARAVIDENFMLHESYDSMSAKVREQWVVQWREALGGPADPNREPSHTVATPTKAKPRAKKPAAEKPVTEKLATEKPATEKPATEKKLAYKTPPAEITVDAPVDRLKGVDTKLTARLKKLEVDYPRPFVPLSSPP